MQCVRCQAEDNAPARFCRVCGYPYAFDEFLSCPVCGGEVRSGIKICPGCHHQFAVPVAASPVQPRRRGNRYVVGAGFALALGGLVFFYGSAGKETIQKQLEPMLEAHLSLAPTGQAETEAMPETSTSENALPVTIAAAEPERTLKPDETTVPVLKEPKARVVPVEPKSARGETTRRANVAQAQVAKTESETQVTNFMEAGAAGPKVREKFVPVKDPDPVSQQAGPAAQKPSPYNGASDTKEKERAGVSVAKVERGKVVTAKRPAPVVERSRVAEPGQVNLLARQAHQMRRCDGRWEAECRQFPDHKPNW